MSHLHDHSEGPLSKLHMPHVGMRKLKSLLAVFIGFWLWQAVRLIFPTLEVHPIYIYIYGIIEMRENSGKTVDLGRRRIKATFIALSLGVPLLLVAEWIKFYLPDGWIHTAVELCLILGGILLVLEVSEKANCKNHCGLASAIFTILVVSHANDELFLYAILRAIQTVVGVCLAWLLNVKLLPYPASPNSHRLFSFKKRCAESIEVPDDTQA